MALRNHLIHFDELIDLQNSRLRGLNEEFERDISIIKAEFDTEKAEIENSHRQESQELKNMILTIKEEEEAKPKKKKARVVTKADEREDEDAKEPFVTTATRTLGLMLLAGGTFYLQNMYGKNQTQPKSVATPQTQAPNIQNHAVQTPNRQMVGSSGFYSQILNKFILSCVVVLKKNNEYAFCKWKNGERVGPSWSL